MLRSSLCDTEEVTVSPSVRVTVGPKSGIIAPDQPLTTDTGFVITKQQNPITQIDGIMG